MQLYYQLPDWSSVVARCYFLLSNSELARNCQKLVPFSPSNQQTTALLSTTSWPTSFSTGPASSSPVPFRSIPLGKDGVPLGFTEKKLEVIPELLQLLYQLTESNLPPPELNELPELASYSTIQQETTAFNPLEPIQQEPFPQELPRLPEVQELADILPIPNPKESIPLNLSTPNMQPAGGTRFKFTTEEEYERLAKGVIPKNMSRSRALKTFDLWRNARNQ